MPKFNQTELESIKQAFHTGRQLADAGSLEDALGYFDVVLRRLPRRRRDRVYRIEGTSARRHSDNVLWLPSIFRDALLAKAFCLNELGRPDDAFVLLERAVELDPENPQIYAELGFTLSSQDNLELAHSAYVYASELEPSNPAHYRSLARLALMAEQFEEARVLARHALEIDAGSITALHHLAIAEYRLGHFDDAVQTLETACSLSPADPESIRRLAVALRDSGRLREAIQRVDAFLTAGDPDPDTQGLLTELLQQDGAAPELVTHARRLLQQNPVDFAAMDLLAWGYYQQGYLLEAKDVLNRLLQFDPEQSYHHFKLGVVQQALGELHAAMASFLRAATLGQGGEVESLAIDAISALDQVQLEQVLTRAKDDAPFRRQLQRDPELTLHQAGILLSPFALVMLQSLDFGTEDEMLEMGPRTVN